jgi:hypothetical protein
MLLILVIVGIVTSTCVGGLSVPQIWLCHVWLCQRHDAILVDIVFEHLYALCQEPTW